MSVRLACAALLLAASPFCAASDATAGSGIKHVVMCWLKEPGNAEHRERVIATSRELLIIPEVQDMVVGGPVASDRPNVEDGFDVGIVMTLRDERALRVYLEHPEHTQRVRKILAPLCARVQIVDIRY
jgi:hypothetical protein